MDRQVKGILGAKLGMTQVWDNNKVVPVTVVQAGPCVVTQVRTPETDGYSAVQLAYGAIDPRKVNKPETGHFGKAGVTPRRHLVELRTSDAGEYEIGQEITAEVFAAGAKVVRPLADQFYGDRRGGVEDPFGHAWYIATHVEDVSEEEMQRRAVAAHKSGT